MNGQIQTGLFLRISDETISGVYKVMVVEGYSPDPDGLCSFLGDLASGKFESPDPPKSDILDAVTRMARSHGPDLAKAALHAWRQRGA